MKKLWAKLGLGFGASLGAVVLLGSVLALVTDSVQLLDNSVTSDEYVEPGFDLQVAPAPSLTSCAGAVYETDDVISVADGTPLGSTIDLTLGIENGTFGSKNLAVYCIRNATGDEQSGILNVSLLARSSTEAGPCSAAEQAAEQAAGTPSCGDGEAGELDQVYDIQLREGVVRCDQAGGVNLATVEFGAGDPTGTTKTLDDSGGAPIIIPDGHECLIFVGISAVWPVAAADVARTAVTDTLAFDLVVNLSDPA
ncbi:MAG: hypothetical protein GY929_00820 [Actinomycetia bacterium]|nr:hypothetical protein [Actinomycetes bacterium]